MWEAVTGQERAVATLQAAAAAPSHAYLLVGTRGSGVVEGARAFAAAIVGATDDAERVAGGAGRAPRRRRVRADDRHVHPRQRDPRAARGRDRAPRQRAAAGDPRDPQGADRRRPEGRHGARRRPHGRRWSATRCSRASRSRRRARSILLLTDRPDGMLATIRSRCQRVDFAYAPPVRSEAIDAVRTVVRGRSVPRVDGRAATTVELVEELEAALDESGAASEAAAAAELEELDADIEARGLSAAHRGRAAPAARASGSARSCGGPRPMRSSRASARSSRRTSTCSPTRPARWRSIRPGRPTRSTPAAPPGRPTSSTPTSARCCCTWCRSCPPSSDPARGPDGGGAFGTLPDPAGIAQSAEQLTRNEQVKGSNPFPGSQAVRPSLVLIDSERVATKRAGDATGQRVATSTRAVARASRAAGPRHRRACPIGPPREVAAQSGRPDLDGRFRARHDS